MSKKHGKMGDLFYNILSLLGNPRTINCNKINQNLPIRSFNLKNINSLQKKQQKDSEKIWQDIKDILRLSERELSTRNTGTLVPGIVK